MNFDRNALRGLLELDDAQLAAVILGVGASSGVDMSKISLDAAEIGRLRQALSVATDEELAALIERFSGGRQNG